MMPAAHYELNTSDIVFERLDDEVIVIHLETGSYFTLNPAGARIWDHIGGRCTDELVDLVAMSTGSSTSDVREPVGAFLQRLEGAGLTSSVQRSCEHLGRRAEPVDDWPAHELPELVEYTDMQDLLLIDPVHEVEPQGWPRATADDKSNSGGTSVGKPTGLTS